MKKFNDLTAEGIENASEATHTLHNQEEAQTPNILIVDDEPRLRTSISGILTCSGYQVCCAENGRQAISLLRKSPFSLVLLDLNMPDISGREVLEFITSRKLNSSVVILSGESTFDQATRAIRNGAEDFLAKPCPPEDLLATVARVFEKRRRNSDYLQIQRRLQGSEELHRFFVNNSPDLIFMLDEQGHFSFINDRAHNFLGCSVGDVLGRHFSDFILLEDHLKARQVFHQKPENSRSHSHAGIELRLSPRTGEDPRHVEVWALPVSLTSLDIYAIPHSSSDRFVGSYCVARDISDRKQIEELRRYHLYHDHLTNLPNRTLFHDRLQVAIRQAKRLDQKLGVMFLDVDRFKLINDSLGHLAGDELLQMVSQKLKNCLREGDTLARLSGDEFILLLHNVSRTEDVASIARKVQASFSHPFNVQGKEARITFSIGYAMYPEHGDNKDALLRKADVAMYRVKESGRNAFLCYSDEMMHLNCHYLDIENGLHRALHQEELQLYYQPQIDMATRKVVGVEALLRWAHPQRGLLLPADFLSIAEQSKLICKIGDWVLEKVCTDAVVLKNTGLDQLRIAINVSPQQLEMDRFAQRVLDTVKQYPLDKSFLEIEITENSLMQDMNKSIRTLSHLAREGVTITVDDFGTGYSSLSYLHSLPLHTLKIDRSFVKNLTNVFANDSIITAMLSITKGLDINFIAEGVESEVQHEYLVNAGCPVAQGFYYSPPLPFPELLSFLKTFPGKF